MNNIAQRLIILLLSAALLGGCVTESKRMDADKRQKLADIHYRLGVDALGKQGMLPKAFKELLRSDELRPNQPQVLDALAYAWLLRGDFKKSEQFYRKAIRYGGAAATHNNYANLLNRLKRYTEAEAEARKALDDPRYPNQDMAFINLGDALLGQNQYSAALSAYRSAKQFNPNATLAEVRLAHALFVHGDAAQAERRYSAILAAKPANRLALEGLLEIYQQQHRDTNARIALHNFIEHTTVPSDQAWAKEQLEQFAHD